MSTIRSRFTIDGDLTDITSIYLSDPTGTFGVKRNDTDAVVIVDSTAMDKVSTGIYEYTFDDPAYDLEYTYWIEWSYAGETYWEEHTVLGPTSPVDVELTASEIRTRARSITKRTNTTDLTNDEIDDFTLEVVREISRKTLCLKNNTSGTLSASTNTISKPSDMINNEAAIDELYLDTNVLDPITFEEWRAGKICSGFAYRNGTIYVLPTPDSVKTYTLYYRKNHPSSVTTIELGDEFKMAIIYGVCQRIYEKYEQYEEALLKQQKYEKELEDNTTAELAVCNMRVHTRE